MHQRKGVMDGYLGSRDDMFERHWVIQIERATEPRAEYEQGEWTNERAEDRQW